MIRESNSSARSLASSDGQILIEGCSALDRRSVASYDLVDICSVSNVSIRELCSFDNKLWVCVSLP